MGDIQVQAVDVIATDSTNRLIVVRPHGTDRTISNVRVVNDTGSFSFPQKGDIGLAVTSGVYTYYIGKLEYGYADKCQKGKYKDPVTGLEMLAKKVQDGEIFLANLLRKAWISINQAGDFSLMNGLNEGLKYFRSLRFLRLGGMVVHVLANNALFKIGSVLRDIPGLGRTIVSEGSPTNPAIEALVDLIVEPLKIRLARFHIGNIKNAIAIDELGSWGARLRAILEVCNPVGLPIAVLKMDELGNIELSALPPGNIMLNANPVAGIRLSGLASAFSAVLGETLVSWLLAHTHGTGVGPSGPPIQVPGFSATLQEILSRMVKLN